MQQTFPQGRDVGLGAVAIEKDVMRHEIRGQRNLHQNFSEVGRVGIDVHDRDPFAPHRLARLTFLVQEGQDFR